MASNKYGSFVGSTVHAFTQAIWCLIGCPKTPVITFEPGEVVPAQTVDQLSYIADPFHTLYASIAMLAEEAFIHAGALVHERWGPYVANAIVTAHEIALNGFNPVQAVRHALFRELVQWFRVRYPKSTIAFHFWFNFTMFANTRRLNLRTQLQHRGMYALSEAEKYLADRGMDINLSDYPMKPDDLLMLPTNMLRMRFLK